jgi:hypothetical protein
MHDLQPMQLSSWKSTTPLSARNSAFVGQIVIHGASSHWLQRITENLRATSGKVPVSMYLTHVRLGGGGGGGGRGGARMAANAVVAVEHKAQSCHVRYVTTVTLPALVAKPH